MILRVRATKLGRIRFVGHRDMARVWERLLRRLGLAVETSAGFTPRPKISFGLALPVGAESLAEYVDIGLRGGHGLSADRLESWCEQATQLAPEGLEVVAAELRDRADGSLQEIVTSCTWQMWSPSLTTEEINRAVELVDCDELPLERERKGQRRTDDVRPMLLDVQPCLDPPGVLVDLATIGRAVRPAEFAQLAFPRLDPVDIRVRRLAQWINGDHQRREVLSLPGITAAPDDRRPGKEFCNERFDHSPRTAIWPPGTADEQRSGTGEPLGRAAS